MEIENENLYLLHGNYCNCCTGRRNKTWGKYKTHIARLCLGSFILSRNRNILYWIHTYTKTHNKVFIYPLVANNRLTLNKSMKDHTAFLLEHK